MQHARLKSSLLHMSTERERLDSLMYTHTADAIITSTQVRWSYLMLCAGFICISAQLPEKVSPLVVKLLETIKKEEVIVIQRRAADAMSQLMRLIGHRATSPNAKILKNVVG